MDVRSGDQRRAVDQRRAARRVTTEENVRKIAGENWLRVLDTVT
jgi:microsomal dipeptidase-like Zn-dependent dipeptidase